MFANKFLSIDIGTKNIKVLEVKVNRKNVYVKNAFSIETPENSYSDGEITDIGKITSAIEKELELRKIKTKKVVFTSKSTSIITREIVIPSTEEKDMESIIKFQIERYLPIMSEDYIIQHKTVENFIEDNVPKSRVSVVAYPKTMSQGYLNLCRELKLTPEALDISSNSICKLFYGSGNVNGKEYNIEKSIAFIDIGSEYSEITVVKNNNVEFSRLISIGSSYIDIDISRHIPISEKQAEDKKMQLVNLGVEQGVGSEAELITKIAEDWAKNFILEIERMLQYYKNKNSGETADIVFIYGGGAKMKGIDVYISRGLNLPVICIDNMPNVDIGEHQDRLLDYLNAAGAAIRL